MRGFLDCLDVVLGAGEFCVVVVIKLTGLLEASPIATMASENAFR